MSAEPQIRQRRVVYLMGFDPRGSSFYYQLLKREASRSKRRKMSALTIGNNSTARPGITALPKCSI
jgi:hypothetical protein